MPHAQKPNMPKGANDFYGGPSAYPSGDYAGQYHTSGSGGGDQQLYDANGNPMSYERARAYFSGLADEDARRYDTDNSYRYDALASTNQDRKAARKQAKAQLAEERRQYDQTFGLNQQKFGEDTRRYNQDFGEGARRFDVGTGVDLLKTGAQMRGARDFVQGDQFAQGAQGISPWLQSLRTGQPVQYGGGTATQGNPVPLTVSTLADSMSPGGSGPTMGATTAGYTNWSAPGAAAQKDQYGRPLLSAGVQQAVDAGNQTFQSGLANKPLGWLENQTGEQQDALWSIGDYLGRNVKAERQYYDRSRPGQRSAALA